MNLNIVDKMSYHKKNQYQSEFINSIQRKALYNDPIFLLTVEFKPADSQTDKSITGASSIDQNHTKKYTTVLDKLTYSKELFRNIFKFAESSLQSQRLIGVVLRNILLTKNLSQNNPLLSISNALINSCNLIASAHLDVPIDHTSVFPHDMEEVFMEKKKSILLIDFDVQNEEQANIAASIKYLYFGHSKVNSYSKQHMIDHAKAHDYKLIAMTQFTFAADVIKPYGFLYEIHSQ